MNVQHGDERSGAWKIISHLAAEANAHGASLLKWGSKREGAFLGRAAMTAPVIDLYPLWRREHNAAA
jgi:hypothetical protein